MIKRFFTIANILFVTAAVYFGVNTFYTLATSRLDPISPLRPARGQILTTEEVSRPPLGDYKSIVERNLFNSQNEPVATEESEPEALDIEALKETELKVKLWGTVTGADGQAYAVIEDLKSREQNLYRTGDTIQDATVKMILRQKIILQGEEGDEVLGMEEIGSRGGGVRAPQRAIRTAPKLPVSPAPRKIALRSEQLQTTLENLDQLMDQARIRPHITDGRPDGISISGIKPNTIFRNLRLRNGDIITGINGNSVESVEDIMEIFGDIASSPGIQLTIKRRGREQVLDYQIE
ncbi:MAG: hypothetical protein JSW39_22075 [Desulfobacterales bacterium]|nr:MAG: hypothetical protein JSW39_22075 [Desulfobacterales bacterium]